MNYASTILAESTLQSYWRLGDTVGSTTIADSKGSVTGTASGVTFGATGLLIGDADTAASEDGATGSISMGNVYSFTGTTAFSVEFWMNLNDVTNQQHVVAKEFNDGSSVRQGYNVVVVSGEIWFQRWANGVSVDTPHVTISIGTTYYVVATYDGTNSRLYVNNGSAQVSATDTNSIIVNTANFGCGFSGGTFWSPNGTVDEIAVYNAVLSTTQIGTHYTAGTTIPPGQQGLLAADVSAGTWTTDTGATTSLFAAIDETIATDTDYIQSVAAPSGAAYTGRFGPLGTTGLTNGYTLNVRGLIDTIAGGAMSLQTDLLTAAGSALSAPATFTDTLTSTPTTFSHSLSSAQIAALPAGDYATGFELRFTATQAAATIPSYIASGTLAATASNGQSFTPVPPNGAVGDLLVLVIERQDGTTAPTVSGWTNIASGTTVSGTAHSVATYWKPATSATGSVDQTAVTFGTSTVLRAGKVHRFRNVDATTPIHLSTILATATTATTVNATNLTSTIPNTLGVFLVAMIGQRSTTNTTTNWTAGAGVTAFSSTSSTTGNDSTFGIGVKTFATAGSYLTPGIVWTTNTTTGPGMAVLLALAPVTNNSRARVTWTDLEIPLAAGGATKAFRALLHVGV